VKVHVICDRPDSDRVLPRMARHLSQHNGWTVGDTPSPAATVQLWMNYLMWNRFRGRDFPGLHVAYFTHRDEWNQKKAAIWDRCAAAVDLRVTTAHKYVEGLARYGKTVIARPPVERDKFSVPADIPDGQRPRVGVSGYTYGDGRKGEELIGALVASPLAQKLDLRASGRGWPIKTTCYNWEDLHKFFQSLNVLVVPSAFEGIPMPPLEALSCGVKVVIPIGVGVCDELPHMPGIHRYKAEDPQSFIAAVEQAAFSGPVSAEELRAVTSDMTALGSSRDYRDAVEELAYGRPLHAPAPMTERNRGVYMVAFGDPSRECARKAIGAIREFMPGLPVAVAATHAIGTEDVWIECKDSDIGGRQAKLAAYRIAPALWDYILYMDADTEVVDDISFLFDVLADGWEMTITRDMDRYALLGSMRRPDNLDECSETWSAVGTQEAYVFNGGVFGFRRCERVKRLFDLWLTEWHKYGKRDQGALVRALYTDPVRLYMLHNQWNATDRYAMPAGRVRVLHHNTMARRWTGLIPGRIDSEAAWAAVKRWEGTAPERRKKE